MSGPRECLGRGAALDAHKPRRERTANLETIRGRLRAATQNNISSQTFQRRLREQGLRSQRPAIRILLTAVHRRRRLASCRVHVRWTRAQWSQQLFTDEYWFTLSFHDERNRVWRRAGERHEDATIVEHDCYDGGSFVVWGGISYHTRTPLHQLVGNLIGVGYRDGIIRPVVLPALNALGTGVVFQHDNAPAHRARVVTYYMPPATTGQHDGLACSLAGPESHRAHVGCDWKANS